MNPQSSHHSWANPPNSVTCTCEAELLMDHLLPLPVSLRFHYAGSEPYTVRMVASSGFAQPVEWIFARELLTEGLNRLAGLGDVQVQPAPRRPGVLAANGAATRIRLRPPRGEAVLTMPTAILRDFLNDTYIQVPPGTETRMLDMDEGIARLMADDRRPKDG